MSLILNEDEDPVTVARRECVKRCLSSWEANKGRRAPQMLAWQRMSIGLRAYLLAACTELKDPLTEADRSWPSFSTDEQIAIGSQAREWMRQLSGAGLLR